MDKIPAVHLFLLIQGPIDLESRMCKVQSRQRVFMKQLLGHRTRVTLRSSPRQDDKNLNLVNSCVGHAETALVSQLARQQHSLFSKVTWWSVKHRFIGFCIFCLIYGSCEQKQAQTAQTQFCCSLITMNLLLIAFIWLHLENDHFKNI